VILLANLPGPNSVFRVDDIWVIAFADDLVVLSPSRERLASASATLDAELAKFNLILNLGKTEVMTFLPRGTRAVPVFPPITVKTVALSEVTVFRYLGVLVSNLGTLSDHLSSIRQRAKISALKTVDILHQLNIPALSRHQCYFYSFVQSQFHGLEILPYSATLVANLDNIRNVFMRTLFRLPPGTPFELFYILWPSFTPSLLCLFRRYSFFRRALSHDLSCVTSALMFDATLMSRSCGWFHKSVCSQTRVDNFDFARDVPVLRGMVQDEETFSFTFVRANSSPTMSFFRLIRHPVGLVKFRQLFSTLSNHHQHVILLCFFTSQMRWCFLSSPRRFCPFCGLSWKWEHFFLVSISSFGTHFPWSLVAKNAMRHLCVSLARGFR
jgi:hypothetical protein